MVGQRIVVRRLVPGETGPSGGPAMTDLLGVCLAWGDQTCVVQPESGEAVTIALGDVVSGKPVPPRPSVRHRASARAAEGHALVLWAGVETEDVGEWVLRSQTRPVGRLLKRANSCLALGDPGMALTEAAVRVEAFYEARRREALVQVEAGSSADDFLASSGWESIDGADSLFLLGSVSRALRACAGDAAGAGTGAAGLGISLTEDGPRALVQAREGARVLGSSRAAYDGDWLGLHALAVEPEERRRGLALALMAELLDWGAAHGATTAWLHVEVDNAAARALYERLGFAVHHELRYRRAPGSRS